MLSLKFKNLLLFLCLSLTAASQDSIMVIDSADIGLQINSVQAYGVIVKNSSHIGFAVDSAFYGAQLLYALRDGLIVSIAGEVGVRVVSAGIDGVFVENSGINGIRVDSAGANGVFVLDAKSNGFQVFKAGANGLDIFDAGVDGIKVNNANGYSMNIQGDKNLNAEPSGHIAQIYNRADEGSADVLALKVGDISNPDVESNFITFFDGDDTSLGRIEGNGSGGVSFASGAGDFAEYLPVFANEDDFSPGDVVGIVNGKVSLSTTATNRVMAITDRPIVVGNQQENTSGFQKVGFIGQVSVKVRGIVHAGDWIVASGFSDGTGIAIGQKEITMGHKIVGQAWESNSEKGIKRINTAIGLDHSPAKDNIILQMSNKLQTQEMALLDLQLQMMEIKKSLTDSRLTER